MKILLIGASSYIGARLYSDLVNKFSLIGSYNTNKNLKELIQLDIRDTKQVENLISEPSIDVVIQLANYSSPKFIKDNEKDFTKVNFESTKNLVDICSNYIKKFIFFSSMAATTKQDLYGELKEDIETYIRNNTAVYHIIRPSAVIGVSPVRNHNKFIDKVIDVIKGNDTVEFDNSWVLQPTFIFHLSQVVEQIITKNLWNRATNIFTNTPLTQYQIAQDILENFDKKPKQLISGRTVPLAPDNTKELSLFEIYPNEYESNIRKVINEIKEIL